MARKDKEEEERVMNAKSDKIRTMSHHKADEVIEQHFKSLLFR